MPVKITLDSSETMDQSFTFSNSVKIFTDDEGVVDEIPSAYKDIDEVMNNQDESSFCESVDQVKRMKDGIRDAINGGVKYEY